MGNDHSGGTAIVVGMSGSTGLAVVRALALAGVACHAVHYDTGTPAMATRLARGHAAPDWRADPEAFVEFLVELAGELGLAGVVGGVSIGKGAEGAGPPDAKSGRLGASLFVCHDAALGPVWAAAARLRAAGLRPAFSSVRPLTELLDKRTQLEAAARAGVAAPWTRWGAAADLEAAAGECPFPAILKPAFSHLGVRALGAKALRCADAGELRAALATAPDVELLLQEYVPGGDDQLYTVGVFVGAGRHIAFTGRKLKQHPPGLGIARLAEAVDEPGLVRGGVALLAELGYEGIAQVEYKRDERDGSFRLMEANFRPWTWLGLATACGVNLPLAAHRWALGVTEPAAAGPRLSEAGPGAVPAGRRRWVWLVPEAAYTLRDLRRGVRPRLSQWRGLRAEAFFSRADPLPARRAIEAALGSRLGPLRGIARGLRRAARVVLMVPAAVVNAAVLRGEWRRAGSRSVAGARPRVGLPGPGSTLVLAPHPDDETLMAGATMAALRRRGDPVRVVAVTSGGGTAVGRGEATSATDVGGVRAAELRAACVALGVDDVEVWDFDDGGLPAARSDVASRVRAELERTRPERVIVPFPYDAHADHVALALALADALAVTGAPVAADGAGQTGAAAEASAPGPPSVLCGAVRMPLNPDWMTRLVPAGLAWRQRQRAVRAYRSRGAALFATATLLARLHPAHPLRAAEGFVEMTAPRFVEVARAMEARALTTPGMRGGGHPVAIAARLRRTRAQRDEVAAVLRAALSEPR